MTATLDSDPVHSAVLEAASRRPTGETLPPAHREVVL